MTDRRLRRAARDTAPDDAAVLRGKVRAGLLSPALVELAAYCGHDGARDAIRVSGCPTYCTRPAHEGPPPCPRGRHHHPDEKCADDVPAALGPWVAGLARWGPPVQVRVALAAARAALPVWCDSTRLGGCPGLHAERERKEGLCTRCTTGDLYFGRPGDLLGLADNWLRDQSEANREALSVVCGRRVHGTEWMPCACLLAFHDRPDNAWGWVQHSAVIAGEAQVCAAIQAALITWALGGEA